MFRWTLDNYDLDVESEAIVDDLTLVFSDAELAAGLHAGMKPFQSTIVSEIRKYIDENSGTSTLSADQEDSLNEFIAEIERDEPTEQFRVWLSRDAFVGLLFSILSSAESDAFSGALPQLAFAIGQLERLSASAYKTFLTEIAEQGRQYLLYVFHVLRIVLGYRRIAADLPDLRAPRV